MSKIMDMILEKRGLPANYIETIERCQNICPTDTDALCRQLKRLHDDGSRIVLYTDIDMDGIMCGVLGYSGLCELGFNATLFRPATGQGYGLDVPTVDWIMRENPDAQALLTADVGITEYEGIRHARSYGLQVFVTDHHKPEQPVPADVVVDPMRHDEDPGCYPYICGAHVLWMVLRHYAEHYTDNPAYCVQQIERLRVFAGFGSVSDSMPVMDANRQLIRDAVTMSRLACNREVIDMLPGCEAYRKAFAGLAVLLDTLIEKGKIDPRCMDEEMIGFYIAPAFNSIKRMAGNIADAYDVFFGSNQEEAVEHLMELNEQRKQFIDEEFAKLSQVRQPWAPYIYVSDSDTGLLGLLAQRIMSDSGEPVLVLHHYQQAGTWSGSGRSPFWFKFLAEVQDTGITCTAKGHDAAFGFRCYDESVLDEVFDFLKKRVKALKPPAEDLEVRPDITISLDGDGDIGIDIPLIQEYMDDLDFYRPFGPGFRSPIFLLRFHARDGIWRTIGRDKAHLAIQLPYGLRVLCWNQGDVVKFQNIYSDYGFLTGSEVETAGGEPVETVEIRGQFAYNYYNFIPEIQFTGAICSGVPID